MLLHTGFHNSATAPDWGQLSSKTSEEPAENQHALEVPSTMSTDKCQWKISFIETPSAVSAIKRLLPSQCGLF